MSLVLTIIAFGLMILIHELGHFLVARAFGVKIETFSIGFGKPIINFERGGTNYRISWLPLGGYVKMKGDNPDEEAYTEPDSYLGKSWWKKALIALAGPVANFLLALLLFIVSFLLPHNLEDHRPLVGKVEGSFTEIFAPGDSIHTVNGKPVTGFVEALNLLSDKTDNSLTIYRPMEDSLAKLELRILASQRDSLYMSINPYAEALVGEVSPGYPAWRSGLRTGDRILEVDSLAVSDWYGMRQAIVGSEHNSVLLKVQRGDSLFMRDIKLEPNLLDNTGSRMIGITMLLPIKFTHTYPASEAIQNGSLTTLNMVMMNYYGLYRLFKQPASLGSNIGGPVMIVSMSQTVAQRGFTALLVFFAGISLLLMIMNLLPIPILDGGHIMFFLIEGIMGRPVPLKVQEVAQRIGFALLVTLMVFAFYSDIQKLIMRLISS